MYYTHFGIKRQPILCIDIKKCKMIADRLKEIRTKINANASAFAREMNIPQTTYVKYERGERKPSFELLEQLAELYNVNMQYLFTGQGQMFLSGESNTKQPKENDKILKNYKFFGYRLAELQDELGYLDKAMARLMGIDEKKYIRIKLGDEGATVEQLVSLASKVDVSLDWLIKGE